MEARKARGLPSLDIAELRLVIFSWAKALREVPTADLQACYDTAIADYTNPEVPFGTPQLLKAWQGILDERRRQPKTPLGGTIETACPYCYNTGYQTLYTTAERTRVFNGQEYKFEGPHTSARPCACMYAPASQRSDFPMRRPLWELDPKHGWWQRVEEMQTTETTNTEESNEQTETVESAHSS